MHVERVGEENKYVKNNIFYNHHSSDAIARIKRKSFRS